MRRLALASLVLLACSSGYKSDALGIELKPPSGMTVLSEDRHSAVFKGGLAILQDAPSPNISDIPGESAVLGALGNDQSMEIVSRRKGNIAGHDVGRFELKSRDSRGLMYAMPLSDRTLVFIFTGSGSDYGQREAQVERALGTLRVVRP